MKKILSIYFCSLFFYSSYAQTDSLLYKTLDSKFSFYCVYNNNEIKQLNRFNLKFNENKSKLLFYNNKPIDSSGIYFTIYPKINNNSLVGYNLNNSTFYSISPKGMIISLSKSSSVENDDLNHFLNFSNNIISEIDVKNGSKRTIVDISTLLCKAPCYNYNVDEDISSIKFINEKKLFIETCVGEISCEFHDYYLYDLNQANLISLNKKIKTLTYPLNIDGTKGNVWLISDDKKINKSYITRTNDNFPKIIDRMFLADENMDFIRDVLIISNPNYLGITTPIINGYNHQNYALVNYYLSSINDENKPLIVSYKFSVSLDVAMFKIFNDSILNKEEIHTLNNYDLTILRNLIFAKHNYQFQNLFYQAYFNLYRFYNSEKQRKNRSKNVDNLLTESDKINLSMIREAEKYASAK